MEQGDATLIRFVELFYVDENRSGTHSNRANASAFADKYRVIRPCPELAPGEPETSPRREKLSEPRQSPGTDDVWLYRAMRAATRPEIATSARALGARASDILLDKNGLVHPNQGLTGGADEPDHDQGAALRRCSHIN